MVSRRPYAALFAVGAVCASMSANAESLVIQPRPAPVMEQTVHELLELDASRALAAEREKAGKAGAVNTAAAAVVVEIVSEAKDAEKKDVEKKPQLPPVKLTAIYGVGSVLHADVLIEGTPAIFTTGRTRAVRGEDKGWRLRKIAAPCVELLEPAGKPVQLCSYRSDKIGTRS